MSDEPLDVDLHKSATEQPYATTRRKSRTSVIVGVAAALAIALALAYFYLRTPSGEPTAAGVPAARPATEANLEAEPGEQIPLPPLDETDALVRQLVGRLSSHPTVAAWLTTDGLILNFALVTRQIAAGQSPAKELGATGPVARYRARPSADDLFVDPASYRRYERYAMAVSSLDARGTARLYATLKPRISDAYKRMGDSTGNFDPVLERAIVAMLRVPVVRGDVELVPRGVVYGYADPRLEGLTAAQKHLLRMGPEHVQTVQRKLREIALALGIPASRLPNPSVLTLSE